MLQRLLKVYSGSCVITNPHPWDFFFFPFGFCSKESFVLFNEGKDRWVRTRLSLLNEEIPAAFYSLRLSYGKLAFMCFFLWGLRLCYCYQETIFDWSELCSIRSHLFLQKIQHNSCALFKRDETLKEKNQHSVYSETDGFQANLIHYMLNNEDILITENALSMCFY